MYYPEKPGGSAAADAGGGKGILKVESRVSAPAESSPLSTHRFLDEFALAYHRAVAERLRGDGATVIEHARRNLDRWTGGGRPGPGVPQALEEWRKILDDSDLDKLIEIITDPSDEGQRLRSSSPFAGTLSPEERLEILATCEQRAAA